MSIYLHIGNGKTGSTSIQTFIEENAEMLRTRGYVFPVCAGRRNHRRFAMYAHDDHVIDNLRRAKKLTTPERIVAFRAQFREEFLQEEKTWNADQTVLVSSEQMSRLHVDSAQRRLFDLLAETGRRVRVIIYLRAQHEAIVSEYSQFIKGGKTTTLEHEIALASDRKMYRYAQTVRSWANVFGAENLIVRPYERRQLKDADVVADYMHIVGLGDLHGGTMPKEQNQSLDVATIEYLRLLNIHFPRWAATGAGRNIAREGLAEAIEAISDGRKPRLGGAEAAAFMSNFAEDNALVAREFLGREDGRLFLGDPAETAGAPIEELTIERSLEITARLWRHMSAQRANQPDPVPAKAT